MDIKAFKVRLIELLEAEYHGERLPWFKRKDCVHAVCELIEHSSVGNRGEAEEFHKEIVRLIRATQFEERTEKMLLKKVSTLIDHFMPPIEHLPHKSSDQILFEYEHAFLQLLRDYKEEVKFTMLFHQELRKERISFFLYTLRQMFQHEETEDTEEKFAQWLTITFVNSYTKNLQQTSRLAAMSLPERLREIRQESHCQINRSAQEKHGMP